MAIVKGKLEVNSIETDKAVSEFHEQVIDTVGDIDSGANQTFRDDNFFQMEPGRCVCQSLSAIGYSHLKTKVTSNTVCVKSKWFCLLFNKISSCKIICLPCVVVIFYQTTTRFYSRLKNETPSVIRY